MKKKVVDQLIYYYRDGTADERVIHESRTTNESFLNLPEYFPRPRDIIIDVGAHIGVFSMLAAKKITNSKIYAIEPCRSSFELLKKNVEENALNNIFCFNLALDDHKGTSQLFYNTKDGNWGHTIVKDFQGGGETVPSETLENFMRDNNIGFCDYMKLNCEGAEFNILVSAPLPVLSRIKVIMTQYHLDLAENRSLEDLTSHLRQAGFRLRFFKQREKRGWLIARNRRYPWTPTQTVLMVLRVFKAHLQRIPVFLKESIRKATSQP